MNPEERRKRHELSYGLYNFHDVKQYFFRVKGWRATSGPALSYDHFYIKPGKNPRNPQHKQGVDYFLGEAELVAYARKKKIFGNDSVLLKPPLANGKGKRRARSSSSSSSARTSQATVELNSTAGSDSESSQRPRREHKRHRRRSAENKVGNSAQNPIALSSDSSDDDASNENTGMGVDSASSVEEEEWTEEGTRGGFDEKVDEKEEEEEELSDGSSPSSSSEEEETNDDEVQERLAQITGNSKTAAKPPTEKARSQAETQKMKLREGGKTKAKLKEEAKANLKSETKTEGASGDSDPEELDQNPKGARPLLTTAHRKRSRMMQTTRRWHDNDFKRNLAHVANGDNHHGVKRADARSSKSKRKVLSTRAGKKAKSAPRSLLEKISNMHREACEGNDDNSFDLGVAEFGESPPRRPPSRAHSRANSVRSGQSSPAMSVVVASPPPESSAEQKEEALPARQKAMNSLPPAAESGTSDSFLSTSVNSSSNPTQTPRAQSNVEDPGTSAQVSMELTQVVLPPDCDNKYHIRVTVSADKPPAHTLWMENLSSHEQREYSFIDVSELPGAENDVRVPTATVLTALFRCLSSQPDAVVIVGPESRVTAESKTAFEKGKVTLQTSTAQKTSGEADDGGGDLTLVVAYPALDLFRVDHHFPMKVVSADQRLQHLSKEVERLREQLALVQTDRDKLCEQLRQQEEENERTLSRQVEEQVRSRMVAQDLRLQERHSNEEMERRVTELVAKKTLALTQAQEKDNRVRDRARRWVFAQSDWMSAFQPCRALLADGATTEMRTSLLRPGTATTMHKYVVEWKEVVEIAESFFQPTSASEAETTTRFFTVVKDGVYQVNANVSHDSLVQLRLVVTPSSATCTGEAATTREIAPTRVLLYNNKRRVSRVDTMLELCALDQLALELQLLDPTTPSEQGEWLRTPMPTHNRFLVVVLNEHSSHP